MVHGLILPKGKTATKKAARKKTAELQHDVEYVGAEKVSEALKKNHGIDRSPSQIRKGWKLGEIPWHPVNGKKAKPVTIVKIMWPLASSRATDTEPIAVVSQRAPSRK